MDSYLYSAYDLACIIHNNNMDIKQYFDLLKEIYLYDNAFLETKYRHNRKQLETDVMDKLRYINDPVKYQAEKDEIEQDISEVSSNTKQYLFDREYSFYHNTFKTIRIRLLYMKNMGFVKIKYRKLLEEIGYKRRTANAIDYIHSCLWFYHITVTRKGNIPCDLKYTDLDETLIFRVI